MYWTSARRVVRSSTSSRNGLGEMRASRWSSAKSRRCSAFHRHTRPGVWPGRWSTSSRSFPTRNRSPSISGRARAGVDPAAELAGVAAHRGEHRELLLRHPLPPQEGRVHRGARLPDALTDDLLHVARVHAHRRAAQLGEELRVAVVVHVTVADEDLRAVAEVEPRGLCARVQRLDALGGADAGVEEGQTELPVLDGVGVDRPARVDERHRHGQPVDAEGAEDPIAVRECVRRRHFAAWIAARSSGRTLKRSATSP